jgi:hypothetical protein
MGKGRLRFSLVDGLPRRMLAFFCQVLGLRAATEEASRAAVAACICHSLKLP